MLRDSLSGSELDVDILWRPQITEKDRHNQATCDSSAEPNPRRASN